MAIYIQCRLRNDEPFRIADDSTSQRGQVQTLTYIPGSTMRGVVINALAMDKDFQVIKQSLFSSDVRFLNAYPVKEDIGLIPSPSGFYEDRTKQEGKKLENVLREDHDDSKKRAALGEFVYFKDETIHYYSVEKDSDLKLLLNARNPKDSTPSRNEYIAAGQVFQGFVKVEDEELAAKISESIGEKLILGNARSTGLGKCTVLLNKILNSPSHPYSQYSAGKDQEGECYMMLLSNTVMRNKYGDYCGLDLEKLQDVMGVKGLKINRCSTSVVNVRGYNRIWRTKVPSVTMYKLGSVFRLSFQGILSKEKQAEIETCGIGERRNEGFGSVLFLKDMASLQYKLEGTEKKQAAVTPVARTQEDASVIRMVAKNYYRQLLEEATVEYLLTNELPKSGKSKSWIGGFEALALAHRYDARQGVNAIKEFIRHDDKKTEEQKTSNTRESGAPFKKLVLSILDPETDIAELLHVKEKLRESDKVMGIERKNLLNKDEIAGIRMDLLVSIIKFANRKEGRKEA